MGPETCLSLPSSQHWDCKGAACLSFSWVLGIWSNAGTTGTLSLEPALYPLHSFLGNISITVKWQRNSIRIREGPRNDASKKERTWRHAKWCPQVRFSDAVGMQLISYDLTREKDEFGERIVVLTTSPGVQVFRRHFLIREVIHSFYLPPDTA